MENFESFEEEKKQADKLAHQTKFLHKILKEKEVWKLDEPSILFAANIMDKIKVKQEKPVFHKGVLVFFGMVWATIIGLAIWKSVENVRPTSWEVPELDFSAWLNFLHFEASSSVVMLSYLILIVWSLFLIGRVLQTKMLDNEQ
jgi:hypothetical protein